MPENGWPRPPPDAILTPSPSDGLLELAAEREFDTTDVAATGTVQIPQLTPRREAAPRIRDTCLRKRTHLLTREL